MTWVGWRLQRTEALVAAAILVAVALLLVPTGIQMANAFSHDGLAACVDNSGKFGIALGGPCGALGPFRRRFEGLGSLIAWFTLLPGLLGVLLAAPFVLELENGTHRLAWTQSITRRRWIATKLGLGIVSALVAAGALIALVTWWRAPLVRLDGRMDNTVFDGEGTVVLGYTLFAFGVAALIGAVWRRAVAALVASFGAYFAVRLFCDTWLRNRLVPPLQITWPATTAGPGVLNKALVLDTYPSDKAGHRLSLAQPCLRGPKGAIDPSCLHGVGMYMHAVYEPPSHFWPMQLAETGLFGGIALALILAAAWWTHERAA